VAQLVDRVGMREAAELLDRSPRTLERMVRAHVRREPLGTLLPSPAAVQRWQKAVDAATALAREAITMRQFEALQRRDPEAGWRVTTQRFRTRAEAERKLVDYLDAGVPENQTRMVREGRWWRVARTRATPMRLRRRRR
jgi:hypothetical protein